MRVKNLSMILLTSLVLCLSLPPEAVAQVGEKPANDRVITFEDRVAFYLNKENHAFLTDLVRREKTLLHMVNNLKLEMQARGASAADVGAASRDGDDPSAARLVSDYSSELKRLTALLDEIEQLRRAGAAPEASVVRDSLAALQRQVFEKLEDRRLYIDNNYQEKLRVDLLQAYNREIGYLLQIYDTLAAMESSRGHEAPANQRAQIAQQKEQLEQFFLEPAAAPSPALVEKYADEAERIETVLAETDSLLRQARDRAPQIQARLKELQARLVTGLDRKFARLIGVDLSERRVNAFDMLKEWQARELAEHEVHFVQNQILKRDLLASGTSRQRSRMLQRDLRDAFSAYASADYSFAEMQLKAILRDYARYYENLDSVRFFLAETYFIRHLHDSAATQFKQVVATNRDAQYVGKSLFRLMQISAQQSDSTAFDKYYDVFKTKSRRLNAELYDKGAYLAGYVFLKDGRPREAARAFAAIPQNAEHHLAARYLLAQCLLNLGQTDAAVSIFRKIVAARDLPWTDPQMTFFKNHALLKLGLIAYDQNQFKKASRYLGETSIGFAARDKSLIAAAWSNYMLQNYAEAARQAETLLHGYPNSDNIYEASVLSARCKQRLGQAGAALDDLRYVINADKVLATSEQLNAERRLLLQKLSEIESLESAAVQQGDKKAYAQIAQNRERLNATLQRFDYQGDSGNSVLNEFGRERQRVLLQIEELDDLIVQANLANQIHVRDQAFAERQRLLTALDKYQSDVSIQNRSFFVDYPLAVREVVGAYEREILARVRPEIQLEKRRLDEASRSLAALRGKQRQAPGNSRSPVELDLLAADLNRVARRNEQLETWVAAKSGSTEESNFDTWANLAGLVASDITFRLIEDRSSLIAGVAERLEFVNKVVARRRAFLEDKLFQYDELIKKIEYDLKFDHFQQEKQQQQEYFNDSYFDTEEFERAQTETNAGSND